MTNACRHFLGLYPDSRSSCAMGRDVRAWAVRCNGGSSLGIGLRLPCTKQRGDVKTLFDCPELDRKTDEEVEASRASSREHIARVMAALPALDAMRAKMIKHKLKTAKATCPWCGAKDALKISCAVNYNNHIHCQCSECGEGFIE